MLAYSTAVYDVLKLFHVLAAVIWVGGDVMIFILTTMLMRENDPHRTLAFVRDLAQIGKYVLTPITIILIVFAVSIVIYSPAWTFSQLWIELAIAGYLATFVTGVGFLGSSAVKIEKILDTGQDGRGSQRTGADPQDDARRQDRRDRLAARRLRHGAEAGLLNHSGGHPGTVDASDRPALRQCGSL